MVPDNSGRSNNNSHSESNNWIIQAKEQPLHRHHHHRSNNNKSHDCGVYFCSECEIASKKSRTLLLSTGGDVILNTNIKDLSSSWTAAMERNNSCEHHHGNIVSNGKEKEEQSCQRPFSVRICVPSYDTRTHRVVIKINLEEKRPYKDDVSIIGRNVSELKESGWFFEALTYQEAQNLLARTSPGTFLMRNSSDKRFLFSLSVQTERGPTSVRIRYRNGKFQLDTDEKFNGALPQEESVIALIERHLDSAQNTGQVWVEPNGKTFSPVVLTKPLLRRVPTLRHLCRVSLNNRQGSTSSLGLIPHGIKHYLAEYPYRI